MIGTGQLPKFKDDLYKIENENLYLIPTSEVPVTNLYSNEIINESELPIKHTCYSACFRKEAGNYGKDTKGIIRQHQFNKVEIVTLCKPENSKNIHNMMVSIVSVLLCKLGLPHRIVLLCSGDTGFSSAKTIDIEVWFPGQCKYIEVSSISNMADFQARRANIKYKKNNGNKEYVHTLNGSSIAVGRCLAAIIENYQLENGDIDIPEVLKNWM